MNIWIIIAILVVGFILAEAFFDISSKISRKFGALPSLGALGAKLAGLGWVKLAAIPLVLAVVIGGPAMCTRYIEGRGADRERLREAARTLEVKDHETDVARYAGARAEETHADATRVREVIAQAEQEIDDAAGQADFDALFAAYDRAYRGVWNDAERAGEPDSAPSGPERVPGASANPV
jgi:hypothetical protein